MLGAGQQNLYELEAEHRRPLLTLNYAFEMSIYYHSFNDSNRGESGPKHEEIYIRRTPHRHIPSP